MTDAERLSVKRAKHRLPEFGDDDAGEHFCHHCAEPWPCEVDRLRAENATLRAVADAAWAVSDSVALSSALRPSTRSLVRLNAALAAMEADR